MRNFLASQYLDQGNTNFDEEALRRKRARMQMFNAPYMGGFSGLGGFMGGQQELPQQAAPQSMASDIFSAIGNPLGGIIPGILGAIFKKRS